MGNAIAEEHHLINMYERLSWLWGGGLEGIRTVQRPVKQKISKFNHDPQVRNIALQPSVLYIHTHTHSL